MVESKPSRSREVAPDRDILPPGSPCPECGHLVDDHDTGGCNIQVQGTDMSYDDCGCETEWVPVDD